TSQLSPISIRVVKRKPAQSSSVLSAKLINEFRFQYLRDDEPSVAYSLGPETELRESGTIALQFGSSSITPRFANIKGEQFADNLTRIAGRHTFKAGADINHKTIANYFAGSARGTYNFNSYAEFFANQSHFVCAGVPGREYYRLYH